MSTFSGCSIDLDGTYTLGATDGSLTPATSSSVTVSTGDASQIAFTAQPGAATGGSAFGDQPTVTVQDAGGNTVTTNTSDIALTIASGPGSLTGCASTTTLGVAAFSGCSIDTEGAHTITATDAGDALTTTSNSFDVEVGLASQLAFTTQPSTTASGGTVFAQQPVVTVEDAGGNAVTTDASTVTLAASGGDGSVSGCTPSETAGVVSFSGCSIDLDGTYTLGATDGSLTPATSSSVTVSTGDASQLVFTTEPADAHTDVPFGTQPVVTIEDAGGNVVTTDTNDITMTIGSGTGNLTECTATTSGGVASFSDLHHRSRPARLSANVH